MGELQNEHGWMVRSAAGTEDEVQNLLSALVHTLKPMLVVETGCYDGDTSRRLVYALSNRPGARLVTCDTNPEMVEQTRWLLRNYRNAEARCCRGVDLPELAQADFVYCDSDYACRIPELLKMKPDAIAVVHDTNISYDPSVEPLARWVIERGGICFPTWRGFGILKVPEGGLRP